MAISQGGAALALGYYLLPFQGKNVGDRAEAAVMQTAQAAETQKAEAAKKEEQKAAAKPGVFAKIFGAFSSSVAHQLGTFMAKTIERGVLGGILGGGGGSSRRR